MAINLSINIFSLIIATIINIILSFTWYGPLFSKEWIKAMGFSKKEIDAEKNKDMKNPTIIVILTTIITVYVINVILTTMNVTNLFEALFIGVLIWAAFYLTKDVGTLLWEHKPLKLLYINATYELIMVLLTILILFLIG